MHRLGLAWMGSTLLWGTMTLPTIAQMMENQGLLIAYPPNGHQTSSDRIFIIGTGQGTVTINGQPVNQSPAGHFAPSLPLRIGANQFTIRDRDQTQTLTVTRQALSTPPTGLSAITPQAAWVRLPGESVCLQALAPADAQVQAQIGNLTLPLTLQPAIAQLPPNSAVLTNQNEPIESEIAPFRGCFVATEPGNLGTVRYELSRGNLTASETSPGVISILEPQEQTVVEIIAPEGVTRTGPSTNHSRLTPLPRGTRALVTGQDGEWLRLSYGAWIKAAETATLPGAIAPHAMIRSVSGRQLDGATEIRFPLSEPIPIAIAQGDSTFTLTLHGAIAQTDTIWLNDDPLIRRLDWQQTTPTRIDYTFQLKTPQQWGYTVRYEGSTLVLTLRHPPQVPPQGLRGINILLDPGHGGAELGARGPNGYPEKAVNLTISEQLRRELESRGATVSLTRTSDVELGLRERMDAIAQAQPHLAFSIHYNALPDNGDAENTAGIGMFWYHPQAHDLAVFLHEHLVETLDRPSYGVFWNNLALTRPHAAPTILMELGFMINPTEFEWITDPQAQNDLVGAIADGIEIWLRRASAATTAQSEHLNRASSN